MRQHAFDGQGVCVQMKSDRELKLRLLQHFGWGGAGSTGRAATFRADKAVQSLTTQVRSAGSWRNPA